MKVKNVKSVLRKKTNDWLAHIDDAALRSRLDTEGVIVTGGAIVNLLLGESLNDYDVYFKTLETVKKIADHYVGWFRQNPPPRLAINGACMPIMVEEYTTVRNEPGVRISIKSAGVAGENSTDYAYYEADPDGANAAEYVEKAKEIADEQDKKPRYRPIFLTPNAISLSDKMQLVLRFYGDADRIHGSFDYAHCMQAWDSKTGELHLHTEALQALLAKDLIYRGSFYPICSLVRARKFIQRGWTISAGQLFKIAWQIHNLNLDDIGVLEDQLTGVDTAYFLELIALVKQRKEQGKAIDETFIMEVVDKIF